MAANTINVGVNVSDNGTVAQLQTKLKAASRDLASLKNVMRQTSSGVAGMGGPTKQENIDYRNARGVAGTGGGGSRDFAKQAQGLGGLVRLYATFAANIFAVSAAFNALDKAAQFEQMIQGAKALEGSTGAALRTIASQMKAVTDGALSMQESMRLTALGSAAGLSQKRILELTKGAKGASLALGRDMGDSIDRVIRGVAKLEPELLDELGVVTRAQEAYKDYAKNLNISTDSLTSYQKTMAYSTAVAKELNDKFGDVNAQVEANPYAKFLGQLKDVGTQLLTLVNNVVTPVIETITNNVELMFAGVLLLVKRLTLTALPEITKLFTVSPAVLTARKAQSEILIAEIKASSNAEIAIAQEKQRKLIKIEEENLIAANNLKRQTIAQNKSRAFADPSSPTALAVDKLAAGQQIELTGRQLGALKGNVTRATNDLQTAIRSGKASSEQIANLTARQEAASTVLAASVGIKSQIATVDAKILGITQQMNVIESEILAKQKLQTTNSQAQIDLAKNRLAVLKMERSQIIESANYTDPTGRAGAAAAASQDAAIRAARLALIATNPRNVKQEVGPNGVAIPALNDGNIEKNLTAAGKRALMFGSALDIVSKAASTAGKALGRFVGFLGGPWVIGAMIAWEVLSFGADKLGLLNKKTSELNSTFEEADKTIETSTSAYKNYVKAVEESSSSPVATIKANTILANTFEQLNDSMLKQINTFDDWKQNATGLSTWWDNLFGKSKFDTLQDNLTKQLDTAINFAKNMEEKTIFKNAKIAITTTTDGTAGIESLKRIQQELDPLFKKNIENANNQSAKIKELSSSARDASNAFDTFSKKEIIKNAEIRKVVDFLEMVKAEKDITLRISALIKVPEDSKLFNALTPELQNIIRIQQEIQSNEVEITRLKKEQALSDLKKAGSESGMAAEKRKRELINLEEEARRNEASRIKMRQIITSIGEFFTKTLMDSLTSAWEFVKNLGRTPSKTDKVDATKASKEEADAINRGVAKAREEAKRNTPASLEANAAAAALKIEADAQKERKRKQDLAALEAANKRAKDGQAAVNDAKIIQENINKFTSLGASSRDDQLKQNQQRMDLLNNEITAQQKLIELEADKIANAEKYSGLINTDLLNAKAALEITKNEKEFKKQELEARMRFNSTEFSKSSDKSQAKILMQEAIDAAKKAQENADAKVNSIKEEAKNAAILTNYRRQEGLQADIILENSKSAISIAKDLNNLSNQEVLDKEYINNLQTIINKEDALNAVKKQGNLTDVQTLELEALGRSKQTLNLEKAKNDILEERAALQRKFNTNQESIQQKIDAGLRNNTSTAELEVELIQQKIAETKRLNIENGLDGKELERNLALNKEILAFIERQLEARKRNFANLSGADQAQTIYDEAAKRARDFAANMKDTVTGVFDAVYSGMDAAIDLITTKMMNGTKITFKEISDLFRNTVAEGFREMAAEQLKSSARNLIRDIMGKVLPGVDISTNEEKALNYAERTAIATEALAGIGPGSALKGIAGMFGKDAPGMEGQGAFAALPLSVKLDSNSGFNMNSVQDNLDNAASAAEYFATATDEAGNSLAGLGEAVPGFFSGLTNSFGGLFGPQGIVMNLVSGLGTGISGIFQSILGLFTGGAGGGAGGGLGGMLSGLGGLFGGGMGDIGSAIGSSLGMEGFGGWLSGLFFANGGVMSEYGAMKLNKYASGGIANSPQMAIYGEGRMNEAYVPLPDGRTIPVTMQGNTGGGNGPISVVVNVDAKGNADAQTTGTTNAQDAKQLGLIISSKVREEIVNQQRSGGLLNKR